MTEEKKFFLSPKYKVYSPADLQKKWFVYWYEDGKRRRKYGDINSYDTAGDRRAAAHRLIRILQECRRINNLSFWEKVENYIEGRRGALRRKSIQTMESMFRMFQEWLGGRPPTNDLMIAFFLKRSKGHHTTYKNYRSTFSKVLKAIGEEHLMENVPTVRECPTPARYFQEYQIQELKVAITQDYPDLWFFIQFMYYCFIRPKEIRWIKAGDILIRERRIRIAGKIAKNKRTQYVAIPTAFQEVLEGSLGRYRPSDFIFPSVVDWGKPIGANTMSTRHRKILRRLGYGPEYQLYSWKHTGAVMAVKAGIGLKDLQLQLRHHSLDQVNEYLRQMGVQDLSNLQTLFPPI